MNKVFLTIGAISLTIVALLILTCPTEADFDRYLAKEHRIQCTNTDFTCVKKEEGENVKLNLVETTVNNRVFYTTIQKTFQAESGRTITVKAWGVLNMFIKFSLEQQ